MTTLEKILHNQKILAKAMLHHMHRSNDFPMMQSKDTIKMRQELEKLAGAQ